MQCILIVECLSGGRIDGMHQHGSRDDGYGLGSSTFEQQDDCKVVFDVMLSER